MIQLPCNSFKLNLIVYVSSIQCTTNALLVMPHRIKQSNKEGNVIAYQIWSLWHLRWKIMIIITKGITFLFVLLYYKRYLLFSIPKSIVHFSFLGFKSIDFLSHHYQTQKERKKGWTSMWIKITIWNSKCRNLSKYGDCIFSVRQWGTVHLDGGIPIIFTKCSSN